MKTVKFNSMDSRMDIYVSTLKSVVEKKKRNVRPNKKRPLPENETPARTSNKEQGMNQSTKTRKGV